MWSALWSCVSCATACWGAAILAVFIRYNRGWILWDEARQEGLIEPLPAAVDRLDSDFAWAMTSFTAGWVIFTVAAFMVFVALASRPLCQGRRHAA